MNQRRCRLRTINPRESNDFCPYARGIAEGGRVMANPLKLTMAVYAFPTTHGITVAPLQFDLGSYLFQLHL